MKKYLKLKFNFSLILEYGMYLLAFLLPLQTRLFLKKVYVENIYWEYASFSLYLIDVLIVFLLLISTIVIFKRRNTTLKRIWVLLGFLEFFVFISIFFADVKYIAIYGYIKILLALAVLFLVSEVKYNDKYFTLSFLLGVFIQSIIAILQHVYNFSFANKYLGMAAHNPEYLGVFVVELEDGFRVLRSYASFDHPNIFGFFSFVGIFLFVKYLLSIKNEKELSIKKQLLYSAILGIIFYAFLLSFSRSAYLLFLFYLIFLFIYSFFNKNRRKIIYKIIFLFLIVFSLFLFFSSNLFFQRFSLKSRLENISNSERLAQFEQAEVVIDNNFFSGVGMSSYSYRLYSQDYEKKPVWTYQPVHNVYILVFSEIGFLGFLSFLIIFIYFTYYTIKRKLFFDTFLIFSLLFMFLFDHWFWSFHFGLIFTFFILALISRNLNSLEN